MGYKYSNTNLNGMGELDVSDFYSMDAQVDDTGGDVSQFYTMDAVIDYVEPSGTDSGTNENARDILLERAAAEYEAGNTNARDIILARPSTITAPDSAAASFFDSLIKNLPTVAKELMSYKKQTLPSGGAVYTKVDPRTGQAIRDAGSFTIGGANAGNMIMWGALAIGAALLLGKRGRK